MGDEYALGPEARLAVMTLLLALQDDLDEPWTLETMAARAGYDPSHFARGFQRVVGHPPLRYLRSLRLERAAYDLVVSPEVKLLDVAVAAGYSSAEAFRRAFVRTFGVAPSSMRSGPPKSRGAAPQARKTSLAEPAGLCASPTIVRFGPLASPATVLAERFDGAAIGEAWRQLLTRAPLAGAGQLAAATAPWGFTAPSRPREYRCVHLGWRGRMRAGLAPWSMRAGWFARFGYDGSTAALEGLMQWIFHAWLPSSQLR